MFLTHRQRDNQTNQRYQKLTSFEKEVIKVHLYFQLFLKMYIWL